MAQDQSPSSTTVKTEFKVVLVGDIGVGKTSIFKRFRENVFHERLNSTLGLDFYKKDVQTKDGIVRIALWDTAGMERAGSLTSGHFAGAHGILLVYSVDNVTSVERLEKWMGNANRYCERAARCMVGNKIDLDKFQREVKDAVVQSTVEKLEIKEQLMFQVSAKTGEGIDSMFTTIAEYLKLEGFNPAADEDRFAIIANDDTDHPKKSCC